jgi:hypothetical protein
LVIVALLSASSASAQVGYPPEKSPFRDLDFKQELAAMLGWYAAAKDPAGTAPQSGPVLGLRYDVRLGGPASLTSRISYVNSKRTILDPEKTGSSKVLRTQQWPLWLADVGLTMNLTGTKSYRSLVPLATFGLGIASDFKKPDVNGYKFGTSFAISMGLGVRWIRSQRMQLRADVTDELYSIKYPTSFFQAASDGTTILPANRSQSTWKHNAVMTLGASYMFFR